MASEPVSDKRHHARFALALDVRVTFEHDSFILKTRDISDGGVYLAIEEDASTLPPLGSRVSLQVQTPLLDDEPPPVVAGEVVRRTDEGIGIRFLEDE
ncbi:PilZ domain-containing protein [Thiohalophilus sp.]|uniref:PilZ domain-containing protein n=1 Tax=Thiohalophilus sp. TaxID=3028392 RepID=UPI003976BD4B